MARHCVPGAVALGAGREQRGMLKKLRGKIRGKFYQGSGKFRRLWETVFRRDYIFKQLRKRQGKCTRCGACCRLLFHCPFLKTLPDGNTACAIRVKRPANCRIFPINAKDLRDRDTLAPEHPCGFRF